MRGIKHSRVLALNRCFGPDQKKNKPGAFFEELVLPEAMALTQIDKKAVDTLKTVPPSPTVKNKTKKHVYRRIGNILANVVGQVANEVKEAGQKQWV